MISKKKMFEIIENKNKFGIENFLPYLCNSCCVQIENCLRTQEKQTVKIKFCENKKNIFKKFGGLKKKC